MTIFQRLGGLVYGLVMLVFAILFITNPGNDEFYLFLIWVMALGLAVAGLKDIIFYFTMAKHMVGGKVILFQGVIIFDFALLTASISRIPKFFILLYLIGIFAFSGVVEVLRALESKRSVDGPWKLKLISGIVCFGLAAACLIYINNPDMVLFIYGIGLLYMALFRIVNVFQRTTFIVIE